MKKLGLLGKNIGYSYSPTIHNHWIKLGGFKASYDLIDLKNHFKKPCQVREEEIFKTELFYLLENGYVGLNFTVPYKEIVLNSIPKQCSLVQNIGAANTLFLDNSTGYENFCLTNTDCYGLAMSLAHFYNALQGNKFNIKDTSILNLLKGKNALLIGYGGAAKATVYQLIKLGLKKIYIGGRNLNKQINFCKNIDSNNVFPVLQSEIKENIKPQIDKKISLVINCTPHQNTNPFNFNDAQNMVEKDCLFFDLRYNLQPNYFLDSAKKLQYYTLDGFSMLVYQASKSFYKWFNQMPPNINEVINNPNKLFYP